MLLNQRVLKSGENSGEDELVESAYIRTVKLILRCHSGIDLYEQF
jgi:hypothetical protein